MDTQQDIKRAFTAEKSFWISERIIFIASILSFIFFALLLTQTESSNLQLHHKNFLDYFFDSVSVGTLTGLFRGDAGLFSFGGQMVLLMDMVINGLITSIISIFLIIFVRLGFDRKKSLYQELQKMNLFSRTTLLFVFFDLLFIWTLGTILFMYSGAHSFWEALFNSSSHILNDGITALPDNMIVFKNNIPMLLSGAFLIAIGGLGISIRGVFYKMFLTLLGAKKLAATIPESLLAPKKFVIAILIITFFLQLFGCGMLYGFDRNNPALFSHDTSELTKVVDMYYMSVSARTAGFTIFPDLSSLQDKSSYILMLLMSIGASSGSFAGGILKLTAFLYLFIYILSRIRGDHAVATPNKHIHLSERTGLEANFRIIGFSFILFVVTLLLFFVQPDISGLLLAFESISAVTNTGLTLGATEHLNAVSIMLLIILMIVGKLGFITTIISFFPRYQLLIEHAKTDYDEFPVD